MIELAFASWIRRRAGLEKTAENAASDSLTAAESRFTRRALQFLSPVKRSREENRRSGRLVYDLQGNHDRRRIRVGSGQQLESRRGRGRRGPSQDQRDGERRGSEGRRVRRRRRAALQQQQEDDVGTEKSWGGAGRGEPPRFCSGAENPLERREQRERRIAPLLGERVE